MTNRDTALEYFQQGFSCSQSVLAALAPDLGLDSTAALKVAAAFGGGLARQGLTCGAINGALMALGLKYGMTDAGAPEAKERTYVLACQFIERFKARRGSSTCRELLGYDVSDPADRQRIKELGLSASICSGLVAEAVQIAEEMLSEPA